MAATHVLRALLVTARLAIVLLLMIPVVAFAKPKILFVGDSITLGLRATRPGTDGFVALLGERFGEFELRMRLLVARAPGLVLISTPPRRRQSDASLESYREIIFEIVESTRRVELGADFYQILDPFSDLPDGIHPDDRGHARMADALERRLLELFPRFRRGQSRVDHPIRRRIAR